MSHPFQPGSLQQHEPFTPAAQAPSPTLQLFEQGRAEIGRVIAGQQELVEQALLTLLCGGHALVEGVPGVAKTLAVKTLARFLALTFRRVQGTPDMMPADILGTTVFSPRTGEFSLHKGPVFTQFLLTDEINRMPPRTQAALLESMEERPSARPLFHRLRDAEPAGVRRHLPVARGAARPLPHQDPRGVSNAERGAQHSGAAPRQRRGQGLGDDRGNARGLRSARSGPP
jgi:hypothetical protein